MSSTVNKGLDKAKEGVTSAGEGIENATKYVGGKCTGAKDSVKDKSSAAGEYVADKYDGAKKSVHDKTSSK